MYHVKSRYNLSDENVYYPVTVFVNGKKYLTKRSSRHIVVGDDFVMKFEDTMRQCEAEVLFYNNVLEDEDRKYFPKLLYVDPKGKFTVWERIKFKKRANHHIEKAQELSAKYKLIDVEFWSNTIHDNWGVSRDTNEPVIFDFGVIDESVGLN